MPVSRRSFIASAGITAALPALRWPLDAGASAALTATAPQYLFFTQAEACFVAAAGERFIPADASGGGAQAAGVPLYMDRQLAGAWGAGRQPYRSGAWQAGSPQRARMTPRAAARTPAGAFRAALAAIDRFLAARGTTFDQLCAAGQVTFLRSLETGIDLGGVASAGFFEMLLSMTVEGFFSHPLHGKNRDRVAWRLRGFPGAVISCH